MGRGDIPSFSIGKVAGKGGGGVGSICLEMEDTVDQGLQDTRFVTTYSVKCALQTVGCMVAGSVDLSIEMGC